MGHDDHKGTPRRRPAAPWNGGAECACPSDWLGRFRKQLGKAHACPGHSCSHICSRQTTTSPQLQAQSQWREQLITHAAGACAAAAVVAAAATVMQRHAATGIRSAVSAAGATEATTAQEASMVAIVAAIQALVLAAATGISVSSGSIGSGVCSHSSISGSSSGIGSGLHTILPANGVHTKEPELPHSASSLPSAKLYHTPLLPSCQW